MKIIKSETAANIVGSIAGIVGGLLLALLVAILIIALCVGIVLGIYYLAGSSKSFESFSDFQSYFWMLTFPIMALAGFALLCLPLATFVIAKQTIRQKILRSAFYYNHEQWLREHSGNECDPKNWSSYCAQVQVASLNDDND